MKSKTFLMHIPSFKKLILQGSFSKIRLKVSVNPHPDFAHLIFFPKVKLLISSFAFCIGMFSHTGIWRKHITWNFKNGFLIYVLSDWQYGIKIWSINFVDRIVGCHKVISTNDNCASNYSVKYVESHFGISFQKGYIQKKLENIWSLGS